jgi:hypothetical protein
MSGLCEALLAMIEQRLTGIGPATAGPAGDTQNLLSDGQDQGALK